MNQLMPAELVAKLAQDDQLEEASTTRLFSHTALVATRHAWIVAAEWLEERATKVQYEWGPGQWNAVVELHAAARELRRAAREDVEP